MKKIFRYLLLFISVVFLPVVSWGQVSLATDPQGTQQDELARLQRENEALRKENQTLRQLLARQGGKPNDIQNPPNNARVDKYPDCEFWLSTKSQKRHNPGCKNFKKTRGRPCKKDEGKPCGICGG